MPVIKLRHKRVISSRSKAWHAYLVICAKHACFALLLLATVFIPSVELQAANVLLVTRDSSPNSDESARKSTFEGWGHTVNTIEDDDSQATYDAALAVNDLVWIPESIASASVGYKLREATIPVVLEEQNSTDEMGFATYHGGAVQTNSISITNNTHPITSSISLGSLSFTSSNQELITLGGSYAAGAIVLATASSQPTFLVIDTGGQLANTYNGSNLAFGPRVKLPMGGTSFDWSTLTTDGLQLMQCVLDWAVDDSSGLVAHWKLDETTGTIAADSSESMLDGTYENGVTLAQDEPYPQYGQTAEFDGVNDYVDLGTLSTDFTDGITLAIWAKPTDEKDWARFFDLANGAGQKNIVFARDILSNDLSLVLHDGSGGSVTKLQVSDVIDLDLWQHFVATIDADGIATIYKNGQVVGSGTVGIPATGSRSKNYIGRSNWGSDDYYEGGMADARIYNRAISHQEVAKIYGLTGHWKLDETTGSVAEDSSGSDNDGDLVGSPAWVADTPRDRGLETGSGDYVDAGNFAVEGSTISLTAWFYVESGSHDGRIVFRSNSNASSGQSWGLSTDETGDLQFRITAGGTFNRIILDDVIDPQRWYHVVGTFDGTTMQLYLDGVLVATQTHTVGGDLDTDSAYNVTLGDSIVGSRHLDGVLDDVRIYNRLISAAEIAEFFYTGLASHWRFDEASGTTAVDSGTAKLDGTHTNGVTINQAGPYPGAVAAQFDGTDDKVDIPDADTDFSGGFSIALWVNPSASPGAGEGYAFFDMSNGAGVDQIWFGWFDTVGLQLYLTDTDDGSTLKTIEDNTSFGVGKWVHCVATVDSDGFATIYRNGQITKSGFYTSLPTNLTRTQNSIGTSTFDDPFPGSLDDVRLYRYALTQKEVAELYGLVGHWEFDEGSGTTIDDSTDAASDASFNTGTPVWIEGVRGYALEFDGTNDAQTSEKIEPPAEGAIAFWMRSDGQVASRQRQWGIGSDFETWQDTDGLVSMDIATDGYQGGFITTEQLDDKDYWYHIVAQYKSDDDTYEIYINGQLHKAGTSTWDIKQQAENHLTFGTRTGSSQRFIGALDDFRMYNRWLSLAEIAEIYGLVGWWRMEEVSGNVAYDSSGASNHGAFVGTPSWSNEAEEGFGSIELDGTNYIEVPGVIINSPSATISGWAKLTDASQSGAEVISLGSDMLIRLDDNDGEGIGSGLEAYYGSEWSKSKVDSFYVNTGWHHFSAVFDDRTLEIKLYVDGVLRDSNAAVGPLVYGTLGTSTMIGTHGSASPNHDFTGNLDDIRVYNRAITPGEARALYYGENTSGLRIIQWNEVANP